jgi:6-phosphogluconolactonase (cycloisomerase 2 family)
MSRSSSLVLAVLFVLSTQASTQRTALLNFRAKDAVFDHARRHLYLTRLAEKELVQVDLGTGRVLRTWSFPNRAESVTITPDGSHLYVALLYQDHSYYWFDGHQGWIAEIDLATGTHTRTIPIDEDPWDIVATDSGFLIVSSGSGQWDEIQSYRIDTGANVSTAFIRQMCNLALHPSQTRVYAADTDSSPSDIERFDINPVTGALTARGDSIYHGDHPMGGRVYVTPDGRNLITRGGGVYTCSDDLAQDMRYVRTLDHGLVESLAFDVPFEGLLTAGSSTIDYYNLTSLESVQRLSYPSSADFLSVHGSYLYVVDLIGSQTRVTGMLSPSSFSAGNTQPAASFSTGIGALEEGRPIKFDASASTDAQDRLPDLQFRWDFTGDGVFDTPFSSSSLVQRTYPAAGTKLVTLQVKDSFGLVDRVTQRVDVHIVPRHPGAFVSRPLFEVQFEAADVAFDAQRPYVYATSREQKKLVQVHRWTGLQLEEWQFSHPAESIALTPDGRWLYVALLSPGHNYYGFGDHEGYIAEIDLLTGLLRRTFRINEDPWDMVATDSGFLVVSSGSGQWDQIRSYDLLTEANVGTANIRHFSNLTLHPSQTRIYAADTDVSPSDIERFDLDPVTGALTWRWDSPYHGDHPMGGNVYAHPNGMFLFTRGGGVYNSDANRPGDMTHVRDLQGGAECLAFSPDGGRFARAHFSSPLLTVHDAGDFSQIHQLSLGSGQARFLRFENNRLLAVTRGGGRSLFVELRLFDSPRL